MTDRRLFNLLAGGFISGNSENNQLTLRGNSVRIYRNVVHL